MSLPCRVKTWWLIVDGVGSMKEMWKEGGEGRAKSSGEEGRQLSKPDNLPPRGDRRVSGTHLAISKSPEDEKLP